ncbi:hypothetical protein [Nocardia gipuzkoensis]
MSEALNWLGEPIEPGDTVVYVAGVRRSVAHRLGIVELVREKTARVRFVAAMWGQAHEYRLTPPDAANAKLACLYPVPVHRLREDVRVAVTAARNEAAAVTG